MRGLARRAELRFPQRRGFAGNITGFGNYGAAHGRNVACDFSLDPTKPKSEEVLRFFFGSHFRAAPVEPYHNVWLYLDGPSLDKATHCFRRDIDMAINGEYDAWAGDVWQCLALVTLLSRLGRALHRKGNGGFAYSEKAVPFTYQALRREGWARDLMPPHRPFLLDPLYQSEKVADVEECLSQYRRFGLKEQFLHERLAVLKQFGRYPSRNNQLGRVTTDDEFAWLSAGGTVAE